MEASTIFEWVTAHGPHGLALLVVAMLYLQGKALEQHRDALRTHFEEEKTSRDELIRIGSAVAMLLERDRDRSVRDAVRDTISGVHEVPVVVDSSAFEDLAGEDTPVEAPIPKKPRARSHPGGAYLVVAGNDKKNGGK